MGSPEWVGDSYRPSRFLFCSLKQLYPSFGYTNPHRKPAPECWGQRLGSPLQATLPSAVHRNVYRKASFRDNWKSVLSILWGQRSQNRSSEGNSMVARRTWGSFFPELGGGPLQGRVWRGGRRLEGQRGPPEQPDSWCLWSRDMREKVREHVLHWYFLTSECVWRCARRLERSAKARLQWGQEKGFSPV